MADQTQVTTSLVIGYCDQVAKKLGRISDCETDETVIAQQIKSWVVNVKTISRYFDPETYDGQSDSIFYTQGDTKSGYLAMQESDDWISSLDFKVQQTIS